MGKSGGIEGDGGAVPFEEYVDIDNDLITFEVPNEQEIIFFLLLYDFLKGSSFMHTSSTRIEHNAKLFERIEHSGIR